MVHRRFRGSGYEYGETEISNDEVCKIGRANLVQYMRSMGTHSRLHGNLLGLFLWRSSFNKAISSPCSFPIQNEDSAIWGVWDVGKDLSAIYIHASSLQNTEPLLSGVAPWIA